MSAYHTDKGRFYSSGNLPWSKLTEARVKAIKEDLAEAEQLRARIRELTCEAIAEREGVTEQSIKNIKQGKTWRHV